jgi:hypothetical protein
MPPIRGVPVECSLRFMPHTRSSWPLRWPRFHPLTCVVFAILGSALAYPQFFVSYPWRSRADAYFIRGLPRDFAWSEVVLAGTHHAAPWIPDNWPAFAVDVAWWLGLVLSPTILVEQWSRRRFRYSLLGLLVAPALIPLLVPRGGWHAVHHGYWIFELIVRCSFVCWTALMVWLLWTAGRSFYRTRWATLNHANTRQPQDSATRDQPEADG